MTISTRIWVARVKARVAKKASNHPAATHQMINRLASALAAVANRAMTMTWEAKKEVKAKGTWARDAKNFSSSFCFRTMMTVIIIVRFLF
jgi:hypothetical protein